jgi:predicted amidophosphoribosyltransferase
MVRCPNCLRKLKERCYSCSRPLDAEWKICPYCEAEVGATPAAGAQSQRRRRRASATAEAPAATAEAPPRSTPR